MMKISELDFKRVFSSLEEVYGTLDEGQFETYYKHLCGFSEDVLGEAIIEIIHAHEYKSFPVIAKIFKVAKFITTQKHSGFNIPVYCDKCECGGLIYAETIEGLQVTYRCDCKNGNGYKKTFLSRDEAIEKHGELKEPPGTCERIMRFKNILERPEEVFNNGVTVIFPCKNSGCVNEYSVDFHERITAQEIIDFYGHQKEGKAGGLCDRCYYEAGRYYRLWT